MSIWTIEETDKTICFVEHESNYYQALELIDQMSSDYQNSPVQLPTIGCWDAYENCLAWYK